MRIAHILWGLGAGGIETMLTDIANHQAKDNEVTLFIMNDFIIDFVLAKVNSNVRVCKIGRPEGNKNPWYILKLNVLLAKYKPDIIHTHSYRAINLVLYPFGKRVRTIHNSNNLSSEYPRYDALIAISKVVQEVTLKQGFRSYLVENGIPVDSIKNEKMNIWNDGNLHIVQVSRFRTLQKGQDVLIRALAIVKAEYNITNFKMHFIGSGEDLEAMKSLVVELGLKDCVIFEGMKSQSWLYENLCNFDLCAQPSRYEGFGLTVAEAMAAKVPVLVSNIEGPMEIIEGGKYGEVFKSENVNDCALKISQYLVKRANNDLTESAYLHVKDKYDVKITAEKYIEVYNNILK